jgi:hypothetical protein
VAPVGPLGGARGVSDIIGALPNTGQFLAVEVKRPGGRLTADQRAFLETVERAGGLAVCVFDVWQLRNALRLAGFNC